MTRIEVKGRDVVWGAQRLGPVNQLLLDPLEGRKLGVMGLAHQLPHNIDGVIGFGAGRVVGLEIKRSDLAGAASSKQLARQIRTLRSLCDVAIVMVMGESGTTDCITQQYLASCQRLGIGIAWIGAHSWANDDSTEAQVKAFAKAWVTGNPLLAVAGTDRRPSRGGGAGWFLRNIRGVGPGLAQRLHNEFGNTAGALEAAVLEGPDSWRRAGANKAVRKALEEALK